MTRLTKGEKVKVGCGTIAIVIILLVAAFGHAAFPGGRGWRLIPFVSGARTTEASDQEESFAAADVASLDIDWAGGPIEIRTGDVDRVTVREEIDAGTPEAFAQPARISLRGSALSIISDTRSDLSNWSFDDEGAKRLTITLPKGSPALDAIGIDGLADRVKIEGVSVRDLDFGGMMGDAVFSGTATGTVSVGGMVDDTEFTFRGQAPARIEISGMAGDAQVTLPKGAGFTVTSDGLAGDVTSDLDLAGGDGRYTYGDGATKIELSGMSGDLEISEA